MIGELLHSQEYLIHIGILICVSYILAQSFNLSFGLARLFNLAHVAAYAVGAYTSALLSTELQVPFIWCVVASMALSALFSILIGAIAVRLTGDYFAIGTLAFSALISALLMNWRSLTHGVLGITGIPRPEFFSFSTDENSHFLLIALIAAIFTHLLSLRVFGGRWGLTLRALGEFEPGAQSLGIDTAVARNFSFALASAGAGLAGSLFAFYLNFIDPSSFTLTEMIFALTIVVIGRPGSVWGCLLATIALILLGEAMRFIPFPPGVLGPARQALYALILFGFLIINRARLFPQQREV